MGVRKAYFLLAIKLYTKPTEVEIRLARRRGRPRLVSVRRILKSIAVAVELTRLKRILRGVIFQLIFPIVSS